MSYRQDIRPRQTIGRSFFHTTKLADQFQVAFGRTMLFGNGLSALLTLMGISRSLVLLFVLGPLRSSASAARRDGSRGWCIRGALGAGSC